MKNGIASRENTEIPENTRWLAVSTATSNGMTGRIAATEAIPSAIAIGTPSRSMMTSRTRMISPESSEIVISIHPLSLRRR